MGKTSGSSALSVSMNYDCYVRSSMVVSGVVFGQSCLSSMAGVVSLAGLCLLPHPTPWCPGLAVALWDLCRVAVALLSVGPGGD